jgi:hypothetical protein
MAKAVNIKKKKKKPADDLFSQTPTAEGHASYLMGWLEKEIALRVSNAECESEEGVGDDVTYYDDYDEGPTDIDDWVTAAYPTGGQLDHGGQPRTIVFGLGTTHQECLAGEIAAWLASGRKVAAGLLYFDHDEQGNRVAAVVLTSDQVGGEQAYIAEYDWEDVMPRLGPWRELDEPNPVFMFGLHLGVGNHGAARRFIEVKDVPPVFLALQLPRSN